MDRDCASGVVIMDEVSDSQVHSFFTPAQPQSHQQHKQQSAVDALDFRPRSLIQEDPVPHAKTLLYEEEDVGSGSGVNQVDGEGGGGSNRLTRLDSSVDPILTAQLDEMAKRLGFQVPDKKTKSTAASQQSLPSTTDCRQEGDHHHQQPQTFTASHKCPSPSTTNISGRRTSFLTNLFLRLSSPRSPNHQSRRSIPTVVVSSGDHQQQRGSDPTTASGTPKSGRKTLLRRIFSRHRHKGVEKQPGEGGSMVALQTIDGGSRPSLESAEGILGSPLVAATSCDWTTSPVGGGQSTRLADKEVTSYSVDELDLVEDGGDSWLGGRTRPRRSYRAAIAAEDRLGYGAAPFPVSESTEAPHISGPIFSSPADVSDQPPNAGKVKTPGSGGLPGVLGSRLPMSKSYQSCASVGLPASAEFNSGNSAGQTPPYLNVSLAAFGYSGYTRRATSEHTLIAPYPLVPVPPCRNTTAPGQQENETGTSVQGQQVQTLGMGGEVLANGESDVLTPIAAAPAQVHDGEQEKCSVELRRRQRTLSNRQATDRQRSSLIILTVAHGSPRGKGRTSTFGEEGNATDADVLRTVGSRASVSLSLTSESKSEPESRRCTLTEHQLEEQHAPQPEQERETVEPVQQEGHHFLVLADAVEAELRVRVAAVEADLGVVGDVLPPGDAYDEVSGQLRSAAGKANLLLSEKFAQFRDLCAQNIAAATGEPQSYAKGGEAGFVTLGSDLEGFWAIVMLQVDDVKAQLAKIDVWRAANWIVAVNESPQPSRTPRARPRKTPTSSSSGVSRTSAAPGTAGDPQRTEARRRVELARKEALAKLKLQRKQSGGEDGVVIFA